MRGVVLLTLVLAAPADYRLGVEKWRADQEAALASDTGWLTVAGLTWLEEGMNEIDVPEGAPKLGRFELRDGKVYFHPAEGGRATEMKPDSTVIQRGPISVQAIQRGRRIGIRLRDKNSKFRREFTGRKWYPVKESFRFEAKWVPYSPPKPIRIPNVLGDQSEALAPGYAEFLLGSRRHRLEPVAEGGRLFFIFKDVTSGNQTYGAGRFLYAEGPRDGKVILDFNKAYNPPCAFTPYATCPLPPPQNRLDAAVEAGELAYGDH